MDNYDDDDDDDNDLRCESERDGKKKNIIPLTQISKTLFSLVVVV